MRRIIRGWPGSAVGSEQMALPATLPAKSLISRSYDFPYSVCRMNCFRSPQMGVAYTPIRCVRGQPRTQAIRGWPGLPH